MIALQKVALIAKNQSCGVDQGVIRLFESLACVDYVWFYTGGCLTHVHVLWMFGFLVYGLRGMRESPVSH